LTLLPRVDKSQQLYRNSSETTQINQFSLYKNFHFTNMIQNA